jgi:DNA polymerase V
MPAESVQGSLYQQQDDRRRVGLMSVIDAINRRYGRDRIQFASAGLD